MTCKTYICALFAAAVLAGAGFDAVAEPSVANPRGRPIARSGGLPVDSVSIALEPGQSMLSLGVRFISAGSVSLSADGRELSLNREYMVDYASGTVLLRKSFPLGAKITAKFSYLPFDLEDVYGSSWSLSGPAGGQRRPGRAAMVPGAQERAERPDAAALRVGGSKRLAFEFGSGRDLTVSQSLDLDIAGKVGRDVEVRAVLSDRNLPLMPEGNTQTLEELDEVYVKVTSPSVKATFGDYTLTGPPTEFGRLNRTVEGVEASAIRGEQEIQVATASPRGRFESVELVGEEGKQGAYFIGGADGRGATIVPGSEKVWIDGEQVRRGAAADYTIDYASGAITFTSARPITKDSRITIDYEYSHEEYRRSLYSVAGRTTKGALGITAAYAVEKDDRNSALNGSITDEDKTRFEHLGDSAADGALPDTSGSGGQAPLTRPPISHEFVSVAVAYSPWSPLSMKTEMALSDFDLNTFSGRDDSNNKGTAYSFRADLSPHALSFSGMTLGHVEAAASVRRTQESFVSMGRLSPAMDYDRWNLPATAMGGGENRTELSMKYRPGGAFSVTADVGRLSLDGGGASNVTRLSSSAEGPRGYLIKWERADVTGPGEAPSASKRDRGLARLRWAVGPVAPTVEAETEKRRVGSASGTDYTRVGGEIKAGAGGLTGLAAVYFRQDFDITAETRARESNAVTQSYGLSYRGDSKLGLDGRYSLRSLSVDSTGARLNTYVAHFEGVGGGLKGALGWRGNYEVTSTDEGPRTTVFVGPGKGHYDADGRYAGVGDYELDEDNSKAGLSSRATMNLSSDLDWGRVQQGEKQGGVLRVLSALRWSGLYRLEEHTRAAIAAPSMIFKPASYMNPGDVIRGTSMTRHDLELLPRGRVLSPRLRYEVRKRLQSSGLDAFSGATSRTVALRLRSRAITGATVEGEQVWGRSSTDGALVPGLRETSETKAGIMIRPGPTTNFSLRSSYLLDRSVDAGSGARWEIEPGAGFSKPGIVSVEARCKWARADREGAPSYDQLLGWLGDRVEYSLSGQVGLGAGLTILGTLRASGLEWNNLSHYFKMEMRALF